MAQPGDSEAIRRIYNVEVLASTATFDLVERSAEDQAAWMTARSGAFSVLVAETDGVVVGFASLSTSFIPIFDQITDTGNSTTGTMEDLLSEMSSDMLEQNLKALENFSKQAIDLIDRNLFERAADVRWWSTDHVFWEGLMENSNEKYDEASKRLGIINASYTMYRDLIIADLNGR